MASPIPTNDIDMYLNTRPIAVVLNTIVTVHNYSLQSFSATKWKSELRATWTQPAMRHTGADCHAQKSLIY